MIMLHAGSAWAACGEGGRFMGSVKVSTSEKKPEYQKNVRKTNKKIHKRKQEWSPPCNCAVCDIFVQWKQTADKWKENPEALLCFGHILLKFFGLLCISCTLWFHISILIDGKICTVTSENHSHADTFPEGSFPEIRSSFEWNLNHKYFTQT